MKLLINETKCFVARQAQQSDGLFFVAKIAEEYDKIIDDMNSREEKIDSQGESLIVYHSPLFMSTHNPKSAGAASHYFKNTKKLSQKIVT